MTEEEQNSGSRQLRLWRFGSACLDEERRELSVSGEIRPLEWRPLRLLIELLGRGGEVATKSELLRAVWGDVNVAEGSLPTAISKLRAALGDQDRMVIRSAPRIGYRIGVSVVLEAAPPLRRLGLTFAPGQAVPGRPWWRLVRALGRGSDLWLAAGPEEGGTRVLRLADSADGLDGLKREWAASAALSVLDGRTDLVRAVACDFEQSPFLIESPYGGSPLEEWPAERWPAETRIAAIASAARAVAAAHGVGVLHGGLSRRSILVDGDPPRAAVAGFGRAASGEAPYAAPELAREPSATMATDIHALGVLLYQAAVGDWQRPPATGWQDEVADALLVEDIEAATAGNPARRLASAALLAERLERLEARRAERAAQAAAAARAALAARAERARQRRPWVIGAMAALVLGLFGTTIAGVRAVREREAASRQAAITDAVDRFLTEDLLGRGNPLRSGKADETLMQAALNVVPDIGRRLPSDPMIAASLYRAMAIAFDERSAFTLARQFYGRAIAAYEAVDGPRSQEATVLRLRWAAMEAITGSPDGQARARAMLAAAAPVLAAASGRRGEMQVWSIAAKAFVAIIDNDVAGALRDSRAAADLADTMPGAFDEATRLELREHELVALLRAGELGPAATLLDTLERRTARLNGPDHPQSLLIAIDRFRLEFTKGAFAEAAALGAVLCPKVSETFGPDAHHTMICRIELADAEVQTGRYAEAVRDEDEAYRAILASGQGARSYLAMVARANGGEAACRGGDGRGGLLRLDEALAFARATYGPASPMAEMVIKQTGLCLAMQGQFDAADSLLGSIDPAVADRADDHAETQASIDLVRAARAASSGDVASARRLVRGPAEVFSAASADPFMRDWTARVEQEVGLGRSDKKGS